MRAQWIDGEEPMGREPSAPDAFVAENFRESAQSHLPCVRTDRSWRDTDFKKVSLFRGNGVVEEKSIFGGV